jgi:hypothetical protein
LRRESPDRGPGAAGLTGFLAIPPSPGQVGREILQGTHGVRDSEPGFRITCLRTLEPANARRDTVRRDGMSSPSGGRKANDEKDVAWQGLEPTHAGRVSAPVTRRPRTCHRRIWIQLCRPPCAPPGVRSPT